MSSLLFTRRAILAGLTTSVVVGYPHHSRAQPLPRVVVTKDPSCGCCSGWADHIRAAGFPVEIRETSEVNRLKIKLGVPQALASCHTAEVGGYVVEGHVPADAIKRLLSEKPQAKGIAVPGMPVGSPGMEVEGTAPDTYEVVLFGPRGLTTFARYQGLRAL
ncbi:MULTISPECIES: DUF411 domain-containing protein [Microvirga]|uniref:DUF411 domain-containing protein n=2 Tax=Microvirga TaxID=186650 RepID=A0ABW9Z6F2_9HYPH|nr:DUF411 domain-containing protein [Microvirga arsenatis]NBJ13088.1 DUF411 domain-containing protein [Microvirga arsenatis]NBJ26793.1 DUF411 domain-containing protein [Microvirga arsenatis]